MYKRNLLICAGLLLGLSAIIAGPTLADSAKQVFEQVVVFKKTIDVRNGIKNKDGNVKVNDDLKVTGNTNLNGNSTVGGDLTVTGNITGNVSASDVILNATSPSLQSAGTVDSETLEEALENELAIDVAAALKGHKWNIVNTTEDGHYKNTTGQVTFSDSGTFTMTGFFAATGMVSSTADDSGATYKCESIDKMNGTASYQMLSDNVMYDTWTDTSGDVKDNVLTIFAESPEEFTFIGQGGCNLLVTRISTLTLAE